MRLNKPLTIQNPNGEEYTFPVGTKCTPVGKLLWDTTRNGKRAVYKIHDKEMNKVPKHFWYAARGCWVSSFHISRWNDTAAKEAADSQARLGLRKPLLADGSKSINRF